MIPLKDLVIFPTMVVTVYIRNEKLIEALSEAHDKNELVGLVTQIDNNRPVPPVNNLYEIGTSASVLQIIKGGTGSDAMVLVEGISRIHIKTFIQELPYLRADIQPIERLAKKDVQIEASIEEIKGLIEKSAVQGKNIPPEVIHSLNKLEDPEEVADVACSFLTVDVMKKQELLEFTDFKLRLRKILEYLNKEIQLLKIRKKIRTDVTHEMNKNEKNFLLREELKAIKKQLGEGDDQGLGALGGMMDQSDIKDLKIRIDNADMPLEVNKIANKELERLKKIIPISPEYNVARTYVEWLCDMPWNKSCPEKPDIKKARKILDEDHYGLEKIKERILEFLAVKQLNNKSGATILCFVGPPGVGKTSLGRSIARALSRAFVHTSLGGVKDEADIRGHRRTYVGALPGRIIQSIKRAGYNDPVFMLDEIDKVGNDFSGDPASALLEALDPEQNKDFTDHYLDVAFDLSKVFFITTANLLDPIPAALLDRMEVIELPGYTDDEKLQIAKKYLLPKQLIANGLENKRFELTNEAILQIIKFYTYEAGLRDLERQIASICRKVAKELIENNKRIRKIDEKKIKNYLGAENYYFESAQEEDMVGVATGLAWTSYGGDIIFIEVTKMEGSKGLILTGSLGEVMQESAKTSISYIRGNLRKFGIKGVDFEKLDLHIHVPEGATPKDGPSAGITMCCALVSLLLKRKVRRDVAMTGEITLTGRILPIGGLKEKLLAAKRARITKVIIPDRNKGDLAEIPKEILKGIKIYFAKSLRDVLKVALLPEEKPKKRRTTKRKSKPTKKKTKSKKK